MQMAGFSTLGCVLSSSILSCFLIWHRMEQTACELWFSWTVFNQQLSNKELELNMKYKDFNSHSKLSQTLVQLTSTVGYGSTTTED